MDFSDILLPDVKNDIDFWIKKYPARDLKAGAKVTRLPPSPTGFLHIGALYMGLINKRIARDSGGIFILRIEDTDNEREVPGARELIIKGLKQYGLESDEGPTAGNYGPYLQSERVDIYQSFAKDLIKRGLAYPCFMTHEELSAMRKEQEAEKVRPGYYGKYAKWRDAPKEKTEEALKNKTPFVLRFKSNGDQNTKQPFKDEFLGDLQVPQNDEDFPILKSNGIPTYHFAHVVDDYLMGTNFVIRGEEWLSSVPKHLDLWRAFNWQVPAYGHVMPLNKQEGSTVRKISKRKDPEANFEMYAKTGYSEDAIIGYLYRLANPSFDDWWQAPENLSNKKLSVRDFPFSIEELKRGGRGPLLDMKKLDSISGDIIAKMSGDVISQKMIAWAESNDPEFANVAKNNLEYFNQVLSIERDAENPRKDIVNWSQGVSQVNYFFDEYFDAKKAKQILVADLVDENRLNTVMKDLVQTLSDDSYYTENSLENWVENIKKLATMVGFAVDRKAYKEAPDKFKGDFALFMKTIRVGVTGRDRTPNLFYVLKVLGKDRVLSRLKQIS